MRVCVCVGGGGSVGSRARHRCHTRLGIECRAVLRYKCRQGKYLCAEPVCHRLAPFVEQGLLFDRAGEASSLSFRLDHLH